MKPVQDIRTIQGVQEFSVGEPAKLQEKVSPSHCKIPEFVDPT
jgi:hypothetical protein